MNNKIEIGEKGQQKDPYKKTFKDIENAFAETVKAIGKHTKMIVWIAKRVLSAKEFSEFIDEFSEKPDNSEVLDFIKKECRRSKNEID